MARGVLADGMAGASKVATQCAAATVVGLLVSGCSMFSIFEPPARSAKIADDDLTTASITSRAQRPVESPSPLSVRHDGEDWRRASAALSIALDPQGNGAAVKWDNPESGAKGSFAAVGDAFLEGDTICRTYVASVTFEGPDQWLQGSACRKGPGDWRIRDHKPWRRPG